MRILWVVCCHACCSQNQLRYPLRTHLCSPVQPQCLPMCLLRAVHQSICGVSVKGNDEKHSVFLEEKIWLASPSVITSGMVFVFHFVRMSSMPCVTWGQAAAVKTWSRAPGGVHNCHDLDAEPRTQSLTGNVAFWGRGFKCAGICHPGPRISW